MGVKLVIYPYIFSGGVNGINSILTNARSKVC